MATETKETIFKVKIEGVERIITGQKELRQAKKDATDAFIKGDKEAAKTLAQLIDKQEELTDAVKTTKGEGVEKLTGSFSLLTEGFKQFDGEKISTAFKGIGSAMKAIPLLLIVEGITYLITNFKELSEGSGILATILKGLGKVFDYVKNTINDFTDAMGWTNTALEKQGEVIKESATKAAEALAAQTAEYDIQIRKAKLSGESTVNAEIEKQKAIINTNYVLAKQIEAFVRAGGELDAEKAKQLNANINAIKNANITIAEVQKADNQKNQEAYKKHLEELNKIKAQNESDQKALDDQNKKIQQKNEDDLQAQLTNKKIADKEVQLTALQGIDDKYRQIDKENLRKDQDDLDKDLQDERDKRIKYAKQSLQSIQDLSDIYFIFKNNKDKGNAKQLEENARKQFNINKGVQLGLAIIDGYKAISTSLALSPVAIGPVPNPAGIASLAFASISTAATIAKIAASQFQATGGGGSGGGNISAPIPPSVQAPTTQVQPTTTFTGNQNDNFKKEPTELYVTEVSMSKSQKRVNTLTRQSQFG